MQVLPQAGMPSAGYASHHELPTTYSNSSVIYRSQYRSLDAEDEDLDEPYLPTHQLNYTSQVFDTKNDFSISNKQGAADWHSLRYKKGPVPQLLRLQPPTPMSFHVTMLGSGLTSI